MKSRRNRSFPAKQPSAQPPAASSTVATLFQKAVASHQAGQLPQAEALYRQILQLSPAQPGALHYLGVLAHQVGQPAIAVELIDQSIQFDPDNAEAYSNRGNALIGLGQYQAALDSLRPRHPTQARTRRGPQQPRVSALRAPAIPGSAGEL